MSERRNLQGSGLISTKSQARALPTVPFRAPKMAALWRETTSLVERSSTGPPRSAFTGNTVELSISRC